MEHQLYQAPGINTGIKNARDLWNATMNGQYPASGSGAYMTAWFDFMSGNRYWELEPYFDVDGGRAMALEGVEYIVYVEKPGPVEVTRGKARLRRGVDGSGERASETKAKGYNGEHFTGEPPDRSHPWVLHISREGTKEGMLKSWKFESRPVPVQEVEQDPKNTPFEIAAPGESGGFDFASAVFRHQDQARHAGTRSLVDRVDRRSGDSRMKAIAWWAAGAKGPCRFRSRSRIICRR